MYAIVILVGGKGTRVKSILKGKSKPEIKIFKNKNILDLQLEKLIKLKKKIFFLSNTKFPSLKEHLRRNYNEKINYEIIEENKPLGTAGALEILKKKKFQNFLVIDGDLIFNINFKKFINFHLENKSNCSLFVHPSNHPYDSDAIEKNESNKVIKFYPKKLKKKPNLCLSGIKILDKKSLLIIKKNKFQDFSKDFLKIALRNKLKVFSYNSREYVKDIGTHKRIKQFRREYKTIKYRNGNLEKKLPAIFLDKDGVINKQNNKKHYQSISKILPGSIKAIGLINKSKFLSIVITNQPAIAKGIITKKKFEKDLILFSTILGKKNVYLDRVYFCPHHPDVGFKNEKTKYKIICNCRKPNNGLFLKAISELNIDTNRSFMIGDRNTDYEAAIKTKIKFIGLGKKNFNHPYIVTKKNLLQAVKTIIS